MGTPANASHREPWNKGKIVEQKAPFKLEDIWALQVCLQMEGSRARSPQNLSIYGGAPGGEALMVIYPCPEKERKQAIKER